MGIIHIWKMIICSFVENVQIHVHNVIFIKQPTQSVVHGVKNNIIKKAISALNVSMDAMGVKVNTRVFHVKMDGGEMIVHIRVTHAMIVLKNHV